MLGAAGAARAQFPAFGADNGPEVVVTLMDPCSPTDDCFTAMTQTGQPSFNGAGDVYVGVVNASSAEVSFLDFRVDGLFNFDGDGIDTYGAASNDMDPTGYGGPDAYFRGPFPPGFFIVQFVTPLEPGQTSYFSLAGLPSAADNGVPEPSTWALMLLGAGAAGAAMRLARRGPCGRAADDRLTGRRRTPTLVSGPDGRAVALLT